MAHTPLQIRQCKGDRGAHRPKDRTTGLGKRLVHPGGRVGLFLRQLRARLRRSPAQPKPGQESGLEELEACPICILLQTSLSLRLPTPGLPRPFLLRPKTAQKKLPSPTKP